MGWHAGSGCGQGWRSRADLDEAIQSRRPQSPKAASSAVVSRKAQKSTPVPAADANLKNAWKLAKPQKRAAAPRDGKNQQRTRETKPPASAEFRQVLAEKVSILPAVTSQEIATERRTTALSLRISVAEHELLKRRAAEANLSVSSYLRNCAFEVESLRAQVATVMAEPKVVQAHPPARLFSFASCLGFVRQLFFAKTKSLAVRA